MSIFLIAIPKGQRGTEIFDKASGQLKELLSKVGETYTRDFLGDNYAPYTLSVPVSDKTVVILNWPREGEGDQYQNKGDNWAISAGHNVTTQILESMVRRGGQLKYCQPVWGHYCVVYGDKYMDQLVAWNTTPALEAIHYAQDDQFIYISNKPLLIGIALAKGEKDITLCDEFITEYLLFGYSVTGNTPFKNVKTLNVNESLRVQKGKVFLDEIPAGLEINLPKDHSLSNATDLLVSALRNAMKRSISELNGLPLELRMSGGKDSRLLLGLIKDYIYPIRAVTFGVEGESETIISSKLCDLVNIPLEVRAPKYTKGANYLEKLSNTIRYSDGLPPSEAHTGVYIGAEPINNQYQGIMLGQWPLMKGGMAKKMRYSMQEAEEVIFRQASHIVGESYREKYINYLKAWLTETAFTSLLDILYLFARNFRSGRWLHGHAHLYSKNSLLVYPLADMEVCAVSDAINNAYRVSEKAYFMSLKEIWPEALDLPLANNDTWRFERLAKDDELSGNNYSLRNMVIEESIAPRHGKSQSELIIELCILILEHPCKEFIWDVLSDNLKNFIEMSAQGKIVSFNKLSMKELLNYMWRILAVEVWYSKSWLQEYK